MEGVGGRVEVDAWFGVNEFGGEAGADGTEGDEAGEGERTGEGV